MSSLCLILDTEQTQQSFYECINKLANIPKIGGSDDEFYYALFNYKFLDDYNFKSFISSNNNSFYEEKKWTYFREIDPQLAISLVKGAIFHHYNAILLTLNNFRSLHELSTNQYGFGSLYATKIISDIFEVTYFDSLYLSIPIFSILTIFALGAVCYRRNNLRIIFIGYSLSILVTYGISNIFAPFLYFIRYFPAILISFYLYKKIVNIIDNKHTSGEIFDRFVFIVLLIINTFYSFEYGLLTSISILAVSLIYKDKFYSILGLIFLTASVLVKISSPEQIFNQGGFIASISGVGMGGALGVISILYLINTIGLFFLVCKSHNKKIIPKELMLLLFIILSVICFF
jgi:hypothetical protein